MDSTKSINFKGLLSWILAIALTLFVVFSIHRLAKLQDEPLWASPSLLLENWEFAIGVGLGIPYAPYSAPIALLLLLWTNYLIISWMIKKVGRLISPSSQN